MMVLVEEVLTSFLQDRDMAVVVVPKVVVAKAVVAKAAVAKAVVAKVAMAARKHP